MINPILLAGADANQYQNQRIEEWTNKRKKQRFRSLFYKHYEGMGHGRPTRNVDQ